MTQIRSTEEKEDLLREFANHPKHECEFCHELVLIDNPSMSFYADNINHVNSINTIEYCADPYEQDVHNNIVMSWICKKCWEEALNEI